MYSKTIQVEKMLSFREIFHKINNSIGDYMIANVRINESDINYDLIRFDNEVSVTLALSGDTVIFPQIDTISITMEVADINVINNIKRIFMD